MGTLHAAHSNTATGTNSDHANSDRVVRCEERLAWFNALKTLGFVPLEDPAALGAYLMADFNEQYPDTERGADFTLTLRYEQPSCFARHEQPSCFVHLKATSRVKSFYAQRGADETSANWNKTLDNWQVMVSDDVRAIPTKKYRYKSIKGIGTLIEITSSQLEKHLEAQRKLTNARHQLHDRILPMNLKYLRGIFGDDAHFDTAGSLSLSPSTVYVTIIYRGYRIHAPLSDNPAQVEGNVLLRLGEGYCASVTTAPTEATQQAATFSSQTLTYEKAKRLIDFLLDD